MLPLFFRIFLILLGIGLFILAFSSYACKKIKEGFLLGWCVFSLVFILTGAIPALSAWCTAFERTEIFVIVILLLFLLLFLFKLSEAVSVLSRKNQELAMQVSLLNQENERILLELQKITGKDKAQL